MQERFDLTAKIRQATFTIREDRTLEVKTFSRSGTRTLVFHDSIRMGGKRYHLFTDNTKFRAIGNTIILRTATAEAESGAPIPGLTVTYRFTFDEILAAFYLSVSYGSDIRRAGCEVCLMDVSWEGLNETSFTGYEYDAMGKPFEHTFKLPTEKNPLALDYEALKTTRLHVALERTKTRPHTFQKAIALHGKSGYFAIIGGTPTYQIEAGFIQTFFEMEKKMSTDLRFYSGKNSPGAWFLLDQPKDFFAVCDELESRTPELPEQVAVPFVEKTVSLSAGGLGCDLLQTKSGVWIDAICAGEKVSCQPQPLFYADLWDTKYEKALALDAGYGWERVEILERKNYLRITLSDPENGRVTGITMIAEAFTEPDKERIIWKMKAVNRSDRWSLTNVSYPQCVAKGYETAYVSSYSGMLFHHFNKRCTALCGKYPTGNRFNMAYLALYNPAPVGERHARNGFYMGIHDADGTPKIIGLVGAPQSDCALIYSECTPPYQRRAGNSFTLPGRMIWQRFDGDWFDASLIYRDFVMKEAKWISPLRGRTDSPDWFRHMPVWISHYLPNENPDADPIPITLKAKYPDKEPADWYRTAIKLREELGVPIAYHLYNWHWVPFNNDNPNYFPVHYDLKEGMKALKEADVRVIPYVQGYFWDMRDDRGTDERYTREALPAAAKKINGEPIYYTYASKEPDGEYSKLSVMCPTTTTWKNELRQVCRRLYTDFGVDGIYLDVVSLNYDQCCDDTHLHAPGWSDYWWKAFAELVAGLRDGAPEDLAIISECTADVFNGMMDGQLSWTWTQVDSVPSYPCVYGGRSAIVGRLYTSNKRDDADYFRFQISQSLVYGQQLGWFHPEIVNDPALFPFLKKMARVRWDKREFFAEAQMLRPAIPEGDVPLLDCTAYLRGQLWNHEVLIQTGTWEDASGHRVMFVINASGREADITLAVYEDEYALPADITSFDVEDGFRLLGDSTEGGVRRLRCRIASEGVGILEWDK